MKNGKIKLPMLETRIADEEAEMLAAFLSEAATWGWEESQGDGSTVFRIYCENQEYLRELKDRVSSLFSDASFDLVETLQPEWGKAWRQFFTPVLCGRRFVALPPWNHGKEFPERIKVFIEPKSAFGTGHHASTALCLQALDWLLDKGAIKAGGSFLDLGCGSGILGIAAAKCGLSGLGLDIDSLAAENARENAMLNAIHNLEIMVGDLGKAQGRKFDLIMANILARPLMDMARELTNALALNGSLILSGILDEQADRVEKAYRDFGLPPASRFADGEWRALAWAGSGF